MYPPIEMPKTCARRPARTAAASSASPSIEYGPGVFAERPAPRLSNAITRKRDASSGIWWRHAQTA